MKKLLFVITILFVFSCGEGNTTVENQYALAELKAYENLKAQEASTKQFVEDYIRDGNSADWKSRAPKYFQSNPDEFLEEHTAFRKSFPNYKSTIKHLAIDGNKVILWLSASAIYASTYTFDDSDYGDEVFKGIEAKNQMISWDETWYFDVVDSKFGKEWDFLKDHHAVLEGLRAD